MASDHQLYAVYLDNIPSKVHTRIDISDLAPKGEHLSFSWEKAMTYLRFPSKVKYKKEELYVLLIIFFLKKKKAETIEKRSQIYCLWTFRMCLVINQSDHQTETS